MQQTAKAIPMGPPGHYKQDSNQEVCVPQKKVGVPVPRRRATDPLSLVACPASPL